MKNRLFKKINIEIGLVQGFYWMASCVFVSFLVRLLSFWGYSDYESGLALSLSAIATLVLQPIIGRKADKTKNVSSLIIISFLISIISALILYFFHNNRIITYSLIFIIFASFRSLTYIIDLWSYAQGGEEFSYGFTRSFGALFYAFSALFFGYAISFFSASIILPCFIVLSLLALLMVKIIPTNLQAKKEIKPLRIKETIISLIHNKAYIVLLISYTLMETASIPGQNYLTRKFEILGSKEIFTGLSLMVMALLQLIPLNTMDKIKKCISSKTMILISLFGLLLRSIFLAFTKTEIGTVLTFLTEPFAFGLYIGAIILYMREHLEEENHYFGLTLYSALTAGLGGIVGNYIAGFLADRGGIIPMLKILIIPAFFSFIIYGIFYCLDKKKAL